MDPISIIGFSSATAKVAFDLGSRLYQFAQSAKEIDVTLKALATEVDGVGQSLASLQQVLRSSTVRNLHGSGSKRKDIDMWQSVDGSVKDCNKTLAQLQKAISTSRPAGSGMMQQWVAQFKLQMKQDDITSLRNQLQTHKTSLHTGLLMMEVYATSLTSGLMLDELLPRIAELQSSMKSLTSQQKQAELTATKNLTNLPFLEDQAKRVISSALTIAEERSVRSNQSVMSESTGSELGDPLDPIKVKRIETWSSNAATVVRDSHSTSGTFNSPMMAPRGSVASSAYLSNLGSEYGSNSYDDDDDDFMLDHVRKYLRQGNHHYELKEYNDAEDCYLRALQRVKPLSQQQQNKLELDDVHLTLGLISYELKEMDKAESRLVPIAENTYSFSTRTMTGYKEAKRRYQASHILAQIYLDREDLSSAETYCLKALQGRYKLRATEPELFYPSARLMSQIAAVKGDHKDAQMFADMVPEEALAEPEPEPEPEPVHIPEVHPEPNTLADSLSQFSFDTESIIVLPSQPFQQRLNRAISVDDLRPKRTMTSTTHSSDNSTSGATTIVPVSEDPHTLSALIQNGFDPNSRSFDADVALHWAAKSGEDHILSQLINGFKILNGKKKSRVIKAKNLDHLDNEGLTPLMASASRGRIGAMRILLSAKARVNAKTKVERRTALHFVAIRGQAESVQPLLDAGADIDVSDIMGNTALHLAAAKGETEMVALLINKGANREAKTLAGATPLHIAVLSLQEEVVGTLLHCGVAVNTVLIPPPAAAGTAPAAVTASTTETDAGPPIPPLQQPSALHLSATTGDTRILALLLLPAFGADKEIRTADRRTPLHTAALAGQINAVNLLLDRGANIEAHDVYGRTALSFVAGMGALETTPSPTITHNPNSRKFSDAIAPLDNEEPTHLSLLRLLLQQGANVNSRETDGCTPLHVAAFEGDVAAVRILLQHGADPSLERAGRLTARDLAKKMGYKELVKILGDAEKGKGIFKEEGKPSKARSKILGLGMGRKLTA